MSRRVNGANRVALTVIALILLVAGGLGLATSFRAFGAARADAPVLPEQVRTSPPAPGGSGGRSPRPASSWPCSVCAGS